MIGIIISSIPSSSLALSSSVDPPPIEPAPPLVEKVQSTHRLHALPGEKMEQEELIREYRHYCSLLWHGQHIEQANQWFLSFSSNQSSWKLSYFILSNYTNTTNSAVDGRDHHHHENYEIYEIFFAIKILHQYIQSMWDELGVNECFLIKEILFECIFHRQGDLIYSTMMIKNQLCCALAACYCRSSLTDLHHFQNEIFNLDRNNPDVLNSIFIILCEIPTEFRHSRDAEKQHSICQFNTILFSTYSMMTQSLGEFSRDDKSFSCYLPLIQKAFVTLSLWTSTPLVPNEIDGEDSETSGHRTRHIDSWLSFQQLSSMVILFDSNGQRYIQEQWEGSVLYCTVLQVLPFLLSILFQHGRRDSNEKVIECISSALDFISGTLALTMPEPNASELSQISLWSIFSSLDHIVTQLLSSIGPSSSLSTANFKNVLCEYTSREPLSVLPFLFGISASLWTNTEESFYFNLVECIGIFLEVHLNFIVSNVDAMKSLSSMVLFSLTLPSTDAYVSMVETLTQIILNSSLEYSNFMNEIISHEFSLNDSVSFGILNLFFLIINQCKLPISTHELAENSDHGECMDYRIAEARRESSQLLRVIWSSLLLSRPAFPISIANLWSDCCLINQRSLGIFNGEISHINTISEALLWSLSVLIDVTIESLCLDDNDDREIEENETTSNLTENEFELLSAWWEICSNVTNMFLHIMNSFEKSLTMDLIIQFLYLWESFPQILSPIEKYYFDDETYRKGCLSVMSSIFTILQHTLAKVPNSTIKVLISVATSCPKICGEFAPEVSNWLFSTLQQSDQLQISFKLNSSSLNYFHALGLFSKCIPNTEVTTKYHIMMTIISYVLSPLREIFHQWKLEDQIYDRLNSMISQKTILFLSIMRLNGLITSLSGDEIFANFFSDIKNSLFEMLTVVTELYLGIHNQGVGGGVDVVISTSLCHIGENTSHCTSTSDNKRISHFAELHDHIVNSLIKLYDLNGNFQEYSNESLLETFKIMSPILVQVQSSKLIELITVIIRWTSFDYDNNYELLRIPSDIIRNCLHVLVMKLDENQPTSSSTSSTSNSPKWLITEIESSLKLCRQIALSYFPLFLYISNHDTPNPTTSPPTPTPTPWYQETIFYELLNIMNWIILVMSWREYIDINSLQLRNLLTLLNYCYTNRSLLMIRGNTPTPPTWTSISTSSAIQDDDYPLFQHEILTLISHIFIGLCYGNLKIKLKFWSEVLLYLFFLLIPTPQPSTNEEKSHHYYYEMIDCISNKLFQSIHAIDLWNKYSPHPLDYQRNDMNSLGSQNASHTTYHHGIITHNERNEMIILSLEEAKREFFDILSSSILVLVSDETRSSMNVRIRNMTNISMKIVKKFGISTN